METLNDYVNAVREKGYVLIKSAILKEIVDDLLDFANSFEYSDHEKDILTANQQRLNGYGATIYNIPSKRPEVLRHFIRGLCGDILRALLNDKYYRSIPESLPNYILRSVLLRSSIGAMPYHIDSFIPYPGDHTSVVQTVLFLEESKRDNGCTLLIPRSHLSGEYAPQGDNPLAIALEAEPGDIAVWDSRIWHATLENTAHRSRWALVGTFVRWYIKQGFDYPRAISEEMFNGLDVDEKIVYGYCSYTPVNEFERTELKSGIDNITRPR
nr:phytanoyl-CoA dioxygenase family protein [uncultured Undibacterium sp.]